MTEDARAWTSPRLTDQLLSPSPGDQEKRSMQLFIIMHYIKRTQKSSIFSFSLHMTSSFISPAARLCQSDKKMSESAYLYFSKLMFTADEFLLESHSKKKKN